MNRIAAISRSPGETRFAVIENDRLTDLWIDRDHDPSLVGRYFLARVVRREPALGGAFLDIGSGRQAFLRGAARKRVPDEGRLILAQADQDAGGGKLPRAGQRVAVPGATMVFDPVGKEARVSRRIVRPADRKRLLAFAQQLGGEGAAIMRLGAERMSEEALAAEYRFLQDRWRTIVEMRAEMSEPGEIVLGESAAGCFVRDHFAGHLDRIMFDSGALHSGIERAKADFPVLETVGSAYHSGTEPLFETLEIESEIERAASPTISIEGGGEIHFEPTRAATVIDVDTAGASGGGSSAKMFRETNIHASKEIARQIRVRNIGGVGVVDFAGATVRALDPEVLKQFSAAARMDPQNVRIFGTTKLGLVEFTRRRQRRALGEILFSMDAGHAIFSPETVVLSALRRLANESRRPGTPAAATLRLPPAAMRALEGKQMTPARAALLHEWGVALKLEADPALAPDGFETRPGS